MTSELWRQDRLTCTLPGAMKWHGWGGEGTGFDPVGRPNLFPYAVRHLAIDHDRATDAPMALDAISVPPSRLDGSVLDALVAALANDGVSIGRYDRICHAYGRSTRDLWRLRHGRLDWAPDAVVFPSEDSHLAALMEIADRHDLALIPFGGGSNSTGCLEPPEPSRRPVLSVDLRRMNRILDFDEISGTVTVQAGILGPDLEAALGERGFTLGHFPDSFLHSTLGGWVATRSSGMFSDRYGNAEDMVLALRLVTPSGSVETRTLPHTSTGPDVNRMVIGSEGALGIISQLTMVVRRRPVKQIFDAHLFRDFESGIEAIRRTREQGIVPAASRLNDPMKTSLSAAFRKVSLRDRMFGPALKAVLSRVHGLDLSKACLMINAYEGSADEVRLHRRRVGAVFRALRGVAVGEGPGRAMSESKFDFPHIRDFLMDRTVVSDVAETATTWDKVPGLYRSSMAVLAEALGRGGRPFWLGCHVSHSYASGCSLYFTFAFRCLYGPDGSYDWERELAHFLSVKQAVLGHFVSRKAALSHHHSVGCEHLPWLACETSFGTGTAIEALKPAVDPKQIMNPGRLSSRRSGGSLRRMPSDTSVPGGGE